MDSLFICPICGNNDLNKTGIINGKRYCRVCVKFSHLNKIDNKKEIKGYKYYLSYDLSVEQKELSNRLISNFKNGINTLVHAVCGSGKTEIVVPLISYALKNKMNVVFAIPRKDVVIEIYNRLSNIFLDNKVIAIYGGNTHETNGDIICLTTHQLYRYKAYFDLIIMDEVDAFPFKNNELLNSMFFKSLKGNYVLLSATPDKELLSAFSKKGYEILKLNKRYHGFPLPVPTFIKRLKPFNYFYLIKILKQFKKEDKKCFIFCPTIDKCEFVYKFLKLFFKNIKCVHSKKENRNVIIQNFKDGLFPFLITTSVLERGVTVRDLQVVVFDSDHNLFDRYSLEQISGRVGRKKDAPDGKVIFIGEEENYEIVECIKSIKNKNENL